MALTDPASLRAAIQTVARGSSGSAMQSFDGGRSYSPIYGGIPSLPSIGQSAGSAIAANQGNLPGIIGIGTAATDWAQGQLMKDLEGSIPGYSGLVAQSSENIASQLEGEVPGDVINQILQQAAERGIMSGSPGSPNADAAYLRALGLTSLDMTKLGEANLTGAVARTPQATPFNLSSLMVSPDQALARDAAQAIYNAAPDPTAKGQHEEALYRQRAAASGPRTPWEQTWAGSNYLNAAMANGGWSPWSPS